MCTYTQDKHNDNIVSGVLGEGAAKPPSVGAPPHQLGGWGSAVSSPSGVRGGAPATNRFFAFWCAQNGSPTQHEAPEHAWGPPRPGGAEGPSSGSAAKLGWMSQTVIHCNVTDNTESNETTDINTRLQILLRFFFGSSANIQQWVWPFTAGVSWLSRPDQLTRLQTTSTWDGLQQTECSNR